MPRARRIDVELGGVAPSDSAAPPGTPRPTGRRRWWWLAVPVVAVLGLVGAQVVTDQREQRRLDALADVPGTLAPLDGPAEVAWEMDGGTRPGGGVRVGSVLVTSHVAQDGAVLLVGLDTVTGERRWDVDVLGDAPSGTSWSPDPTGCSVVPGGSGEVACLVTDGGEREVDDEVVPVPARAPHLVVVDAADGTVRVDREVPAWGQWPTLTGDDVLLVGDVGGTLHVARQGLRDGTERWSTTAEGRRTRRGR